MTEIAVSELLAHAAPMILVDRVQAVRQDHIRTSVRISGNSPFIREAGVPAHIVVEYMAQSVAALSGWQGRQRGEAPKIGLLLGTRNLQLHANWFRPGEEIEIAAAERYNDGAMASFDCQAWRDGDLVAEARLNVYQPKDAGFFINPDMQAGAQ